MQPSAAAILSYGPTASKEFSSFVWEEKQRKGKGLLDVLYRAGGFDAFAEECHAIVDVRPFEVLCRFARVASSVDVSDDVPGTMAPESLSEALNFIEQNESPT